MFQPRNALAPRVRKRSGQTVLGMTWAFVACVVAAYGVPQSPIEICEYAPDTDPVRFKWPTQIAFGPEGTEIVTDLKNNRLVYRNHPSEAFRVSPVGLKGSHSVAYNPADQLYYICDTEHQRLVAISDLSTGEIRAQTSALAGIALDRPHDIVIDPVTGWLYTINPNKPQIFRFKAFGQDESVLDLSNVLSYSRALTLVNGRLYVVGSADGKVVEITDFDAGKYTVHASAGKIKTAPAGSWTTTGLVLNDIEFFAGYWYATSYFTPSFSAGTDFDKNRLIRFLDWNDFALGRWEDLSPLLPSKAVPYYLTRNQDSLYFTTFNHASPGTNDRVYRLFPLNLKEVK